MDYKNIPKGAGEMRYYQTECPFCGGKVSRKNYTRIPDVLFHDTLFVCPHCDYKIRIQLEYERNVTADWHEESESE